MRKLLTSSLCLLATSLLLSACDSDPERFSFGGKSPKGVCKDYPNLCEDLNKDGWCRMERDEVIFARLEGQDQPGDPAYYTLIRAYQAYNRCIELAAQIQPKYDQSRQAQRVVGLLTSVEELARLEQLTKSSDYPFLLMYHWTVLGDKSAKQRFLNLEGSPQMAHPELQWALASYYADFEPVKTIAILKNTFPLHENADDIPAKYAETIVGQYMRLGDFQRAYLWTLVASHFDDHAQQDYGPLERQLNLTKDQRKQLEKQAKELYKTITKRS